MAECSICRKEVDDHNNHIRKEHKISHVTARGLFGKHSEHSLDASRTEALLFHLGGCAKCASVLDKFIESKLKVPGQKRLDLDREPGCDRA